MKLHIENINITLHQPPAGLIATLAMAGAMRPAAEVKNVPAIGEKWPGTEATYAGISLSQEGDSLIHLLLWDDQPKDGMEYDKAVKYAAQVNPAMSSHLPTRHQSIDLFDRLQDQFNQDCYHWTLTKTKSGKAAFLQDFINGSQLNFHLSAECRVRAVSEIPL